MPRVAPEDTQSIAHIKFICDSIHDFGDDLYENLINKKKIKPPQASAIMMLTKLK